jgi:hypothetical protein
MIPLSLLMTGENKTIQTTLPLQLMASFDIADLPNGMYFIKIRTGKDEILEAKLIKQ